MRNFEPQTLTEEEVPQGVIDDLKKHYKEVTFDLDIGIDTETVSKKAKYFEKETELTRGIVMNAKTFQPMTGMGYNSKSYLVRINETDTGCSVRQVITANIFEVVGDLISMEAMQDNSVK